MALVQQMPATVDVTMVRGDEFSWPLEFATELTSYTFSSGIYNAGASATTSVVTPSLTTTIAGGKTTVLVSVNETQSATLSPTGSYRWYLRWVSPGGVTRTVAAGRFTANLP